MKRRQLIARITAGMMCLSAVITAYPVKTAEAVATAETVTAAKTMTILETDVQTASAGCTMLGVYGSYYSQAQDALDRINEIRKEACEAGNVPYPGNPSRTLTADDYVPIKWSTDLESIARIRAAEGGLAYSFLASGHNRLSKKGTFTVSYNGITSSAEDLAYNYGTSMVSGINQWYEEKADWVNQVSGKVTGHYTSMIDPKFTYVGLGDFYTEEAMYPNTLAGEFSASSAVLDNTMQTAPTEVMQKIEVNDSYIKGYVFEGKTTIGLEQPETLTLRAELLNDSKSLKLWAVGSMEYTSSDTSVATITNEGVVTGHKSGEATITVKSNGNILTSATITVRCRHDKELLSLTDSTCTTEGLGVYYCDTCDARIEQIIPKLEHDYVYGNIDSEGYTTGICSMCQDSIRIIRPTTCNIYWRNSTSNDNYYYTHFPTSNPIDSVIYCWIKDMNGDKASQDVIIESADESVISVPETVVPNSSNNRLRVLAPGITIITVYPKYNLTLKKTFTVRVGDTGSVDIVDADVTLSQESYDYTGSACKPTVSVSYHDVDLKADTDYTVSYENNTEIGTATVIITGAGIFRGTLRKNFSITGTMTPTPQPTGTVVPTPGATGTVTPTPQPTGTSKPGATGTVTPTLQPTGTSKPGTEIPGTETPEPDTSEQITGTSYAVGAYQYQTTGASTVAMVDTKSSNAKKIKVPKTIQIDGKTYTVTAIADNAFKKNKKITSVTIGDNVKTIGTSAFEGCAKMTKITLGKGVTQIGGSAFKNCKKLKTIVIQSTKLKKVGKNTLKGIKPTAKIKVPAKKLSKYKKLFKNKGQGKKLKIVKK